MQTLGTHKLGFKAVRKTVVSRGRLSRIAAQQHNNRGSDSSARVAVRPTPYTEPFFRTFLLGVGAGALLEGCHVAAQVLGGTFPGVSQFSPLLVADHVTAFASWICLYCIEAAAIMTGAAAAGEINLNDLPNNFLSLNFMKAGSKLATPEAPVVLAAEHGAQSALVDKKTVQQQATHVKGARNSVLPAPVRKPAPGGKPPQEEEKYQRKHEKRTKELKDRSGYLKNQWYAVALSDKVGKDPYKVQLCGKEMVIFRGDNDEVHCIDNACPHRGAPLSQGWISKKAGQTCITCPYHGWAMDGDSVIRDVPAAAHKGEWPKRPLSDAYHVEDKGGFIWLFYGSNTLPADERPPIPFVPELEDPEWKAVYEEIEFDCNHFGVFENAIDMAHIHYLHGDSFGNGEKPEIRDMEAVSDAYSVTATFRINNKAPNPFWELFKVPEVHVTAKAFLPSTSVVTFTLGFGLSFTTFVNTVPISANKTINRFALVRKLSWDKTGIFNWRLWDSMARQAMMKIQLEDKDMVEELRYDQLPAEYSVRADLPQVAFRKLRQQWVDLGYGLPTEEELPPYEISNKDM